jgi:hypothetical protein
MGLLADIQKNVKAHHVIFVIGLLVAAVALIQYNGAKGAAISGMTAGNMTPQQQEAMYMDASGYGGAASPASPGDLEGGLGDAAPVHGGRPAGGLPSCASRPVTNPADLLPSDANNEWAKLNPRASGDFQNVNLLRAGYWNGIDTVGSSLRNANLQVRSEPPNPTNPVSIWNNTTIAPDLMRTPLEIGQGCQ